MFDISWGEIVVVTGVGFALVGKKDLPRVFHTCGTQVGRLVGLLQGARARADRFSSNNELRQLQNEFRSGLREIDAVRSELAVSMSSRGVVGKGLGTMVPSANRVRTGGGSNGSSNNNYSNNNQISATATNPGSTLTMPAAAAAVKTFPDEPVSEGSLRRLAPRSQSVAAVAEEEWVKQGIGFRSKAEQVAGDDSGSALLSNLLRETLIHDQHDRAVQEQDDILQSKVKDFEARRNEKKSE